MIRFFGCWARGSGRSAVEFVLVGVALGLSGFAEATLTYNVARVFGCRFRHASLSKFMIYFEGMGERRLCGGISRWSKPAYFGTFMLLAGCHEPTMREPIIGEPR